MKNTITDLNNYLFEEIERLTDDELSGEEFDKAVKRSKAVNDVAKTIVANGALALNAQKYLFDSGQETKVEIPLLGFTDK